MSKKNNARIAKWRIMINEGLAQDPMLLKSRIRKGVPAAIRAIAWPEIIKLDNFVQEHKKNYTFAKLINSPSNATYEISLDIPRTFPEEQDSKVLRKSLNNVLKAISIVYPRVGYCQGMNFLALRLLQIIQDEEAFWILNYLFANDPCLMKNFVDPKSIEEESYVFHQLMKEFTPKVHARFQAQNITVQIFSIKWFMTLFSSVLNQELFYRVFQVYLNEGWSAIFAVGLTFLRLNESRLLENSFEENLFLLNAEIYEVISIQSFMEEVFRFEVPNSTIKTHSEAYRKMEDAKSQKQEGLSRNSVARLREMEKAVLPVPQDENYKQLIFQSKSEQVTFDVFALLGEEKTKKRL